MTPAADRALSSGSEAAKRADLLFLAGVVAISVLPYVFQLGFSSDDWAFLSSMRFSSDHSALGRFHAVFAAHDNAARPVQFGVLAVLYSVFGLEPTGYHLFNAAVLLLGIVLFHLVLVELAQPRTIAVAVPLLYALLPNYATDRFWVAAFQATLSMMLFFLHLYAELRSLRPGQIPPWGWKGLAALALLASVFAYEVFIPLFLLTPLLVDRRFRSDGRPTGVGTRWTGGWAAWAPTLLLLLPAVALKRLTMSRMRSPDGVVDQLFYVYGLAKRAVGLGSPRSYGLDIGEAVRVHFWTYGAGFPAILVRLLRQHLDAAAVATACLLGGVIFAYLHSLREASDAGSDARRRAAALIATGMVVFAGGYAIFLTTENVGFTPTGIGNRTAIAATCGVAISGTGALAWLTSWCPSVNLRRGIFCGLLALWCAAGSAVISTLGSFWGAAYQRQLAILSQIRRNVPPPPAASAFLLDGVCPYHGPAVVFETSWDLTGALRLAYGDPSLHADVVSPRLRVEWEGLVTSIYDQKQRYDYDKLFIYDARGNRLYNVENSMVAQRYFARPTPPEALTCPSGKPGHGTSMF